MTVFCKHNCFSVLIPPPPISLSSKFYKKLVEQLFSCFNHASYIPKDLDSYLPPTQSDPLSPWIHFTKSQRGLVLPRVTQLVSRGIGTLKVKTWFRAQVCWLLNQLSFCHLIPPPNLRYYSLTDIDTALSLFHVNLPRGPPSLSLSQNVTPSFPLLWKHELSPWNPVTLLFREVPHLLGNKPLFQNV